MRFATRCIFISKHFLIPFSSIREPRREENALKEREVPNEVAGIEFHPSAQLEMKT